MVNKFDMQTLMVAWGKLVFDHCSPGHQKIGACTVWLMILLIENLLFLPQALILVLYKASNI